MRKPMPPLFADDEIVLYLSPASRDLIVRCRVVGMRTEPDGESRWRLEPVDPPAHSFINTSAPVWATKEYIRKT